MKARIAAIALWVFRWASPKAPTPVLDPAHVHEDFPKMIYRWRAHGLEAQVVGSEAALEAAETQGFSVNYPKGPS